ncbi:hypothetical protein BDZ89DRAFT_1036169 [Hymenopellis radicata]|nr:hypothetical protein BDZ89DRAFT_1036169 [Hymenopellis radicata]
MLRTLTGLLCPSLNSDIGSWRIERLQLDGQHGFFLDLIWTILVCASKPVNYEASPDGLGEAARHMTRELPDDNGDGMGCAIAEQSGNSTSIVVRFGGNTMCSHMESCSETGTRRSGIRVGTLSSQRDCPLASRPSKGHIGTPVPTLAYELMWGSDRRHDYGLTGILLHGFSVAA